MDVADHSRPDTTANPPPGSPPDWLTTWRQEALDTAQALARYDGLPAIEADRMTGVWRGSGLATGHAFDGMLESLGWYGKRFRSAEEVDPLLFADPRGGFYAIKPGLLPMDLALTRPDLARRPLVEKLFRNTRLVLETDRPAARLREIRHRGVESAAMVYDTLPIIDHFRRIDTDRVLGLMDMRGMPQPFFFLLERDGPPRV